MTAYATRLRWVFRLSFLGALGAFALLFASDYGLGPAVAAAGVGLLCLSVTAGFIGLYLRERYKNRCERSGGTFTEPFPRDVLVCASVLFIGVGAVAVIVELIENWQRVLSAIVRIMAMVLSVPAAIVGVVADSASALDLRALCWLAIVLLVIQLRETANLKNQIRQMEERLLHARAPL